MGEITELQKSILEFVTWCIQDHGYPPSIREIGRHFRIGAASSVAYHLKMLEKKGHLKRQGAVSRGITVTADPFRLPILGSVAAGSGTIAQEDIEGHLSLGEEVSRGADFILQVRGDSMEGAGILQGDLIQIKKTRSAREGDVVVAIVDNEEGVVKRLAKRRGAWQLHSENPKYSPITEDFQVVGKVVGLIRSYAR